VSLGATYDVAANAKILVGGYLPVGPGPTTTAAGPVARSEFGLYPYFGFAELTLVL
jgi:hypothetical protein